MPDPAAQRALLNAAYEKVWIYSTTLFRSLGRDEPFNPAGSGTFVRVGTRPCLLTAAHVWEPFLKDKVREQLAFSIDGRRPAVTVLSGGLTCLYVSTWKVDEWGPDIALIEIPDAYAGRLEAAGKAFYDLTRRRPEVLATTVAYQSGLWLVAAVPGEWVENKGRQSDGAAAGIQVGVAVIGSTVRAVATRDGLDYVDLSLYEEKDPGFPAKWGGVSGAGLWQVGATEGDKIVWDGQQASLEGVAFYYEPGATPEDEVIRCHGRWSIYEHLLTALG